MQNFIQTSNGVKKTIFFLSLFFVIFFAFASALPQDAQAQGLVPCGGPAQDPCNFCHGFVLINNIIIFFLIPDGLIPGVDVNNNIAIVPILASLLIAVGGFFMLTSAANPQGLARGRTIIFAVVVGLLIVYGAWIFISLLVESLGVVDFSGAGVPWNEINCTFE